MPERIYEDPDLGPVRLRRNARSRYIRLRITPKEQSLPDGGKTRIAVTLPLLASWRSGIAFFLSKKDWIVRTLARQEKLAAQYNDDVPAFASEEEQVRWIEGLRAEAKRTLPPRLAELAAANGFTYNRLFIKHNRTNWGSCSTRGNINLNLNLIRLPQELQDYVMLHELCHLQEMNHGPRFHALLESVCPDHLSKARAIRRWRIV